MPTGDDRANDILDAVYGSSHGSSLPGTLYVALYHGRPTEAGGGTEASYDTYSRVALTNNDTNFPPAADRRKEVGVDVEFPVPGEDTSRFVAWGIHGHATNDDLISSGTLADRVAGVEGREVRFPAGSLTIELV